MSNDGVVAVKDLWIKKVWQITRCMEDWAINLQIKQNVVHKIRPGVWYTYESMIAAEEDPRISIEEFIDSLSEDRDKAICEAIMDFGTVNNAAHHLNIPESTLRVRFKRDIRPAAIKAGLGGAR